MGKIKYIISAFVTKTDEDEEELEILTNLKLKLE